MAWAVVAGAAISVVGGSILNNSGGGNSASQGSERLANSQAQIGEEQWNRYKQVFMPLEDKYVADAQNYDSPENYAKAAGAASATTSEQFGKARDRLTRTPGLDPSSAAYGATIAGLDMSQAAVDATSQNAARQKVSDTAWARKTDALSLGKGLPAQASSTLGAASAGLSSLGMQQTNQANAGGAALGRVVSAGFNAFNRPGLDTFKQDPTVPTDSNGYLQFDP